MSVRSIYLVFSRTGTWLSRLISLFNEGKYVHTSISLDNSFTQMYSFGRVNPKNPLSGGFVEENLFDGVYKKFSGSECLIYRLEITEEQFKIIKSEINRFLIEKDKYKYNFIGLLGILFNKPIKRKDYYFCTQFVSELLIKSSIYNTNKNPELVKPDDLIYIGHKEIVYEGYINGCLELNEVYNFS
jgi:hypothetical protein